MFAICPHDQHRKQRISDRFPHPSVIVDWSWCSSPLVTSRPFSLPQHPSSVSPVLSLRDNLVITLHNSEGTEMSRAVVKTVQVMENGFLDAWIPLEGGGYAHMIFQFSLNEDERKRIYEKRKSAVKNKYTDLGHSGRRHSFSEGVLRPSTSKADELSKESRSTSQSLPKAPEVSSIHRIRLLPEELQEHPASNSDQAKVLTELLPTNADKLQESAGERLNFNSIDMVTRHFIAAEDSTILLSTKVEGLASEKQNVEKHSASLVKNMISAFEISLLQENPPRPYLEPIEKSRLRKIESTGSMKEVCSDKGQLGSQTLYSEEILAAETLTKSASSGLLFEMGHEQTSGYLISLPPNEGEDRSASSNSIGPKTSRNRLNVEQGTILRDEDAMSGGVSGIEQASQVNSGKLEESSEYISSTNEQKFSVGVIHVKSMHGSCKQEPYEPKEYKEPHYPSAHMIQSSPGVPLSDNEFSHCQDGKVGPGESSASETIDGNRKSYGSSTYMEQTAVNAPAGPRNEFIASTTCEISTDIEYSHISVHQELLLAANNAARVESLDRSNDESMKTSAWLSFGEGLQMTTETCLLWYPSFWKRRPCLTTAVGPFVYKLEGYDILLATHPQTVTDLNACKEHKKHGGLLDKAFKNKDTSRMSTKSCSQCILPMPKISKGLIEQGLKIIILVVACGTLILNAGAR